MLGRGGEGVAGGEDVIAGRREGGGVESGGLGGGETFDSEAGGEAVGVGVRGGV